MNILQIADQFPPCLCRFIARKKNGHAPLSVRELAQKSGLSKSKVATMSLLESWKGIAIEDVLSFSQACGVDLMRPRDARAYLKSSAKVHIQNADPAQKKFFLRLFKGRG